LTWLGLASGTAIIMMGRFQNDAIDLMVDNQFRRTERHEIAVDAAQPRARSARRELEHLSGVLRVEPVRVLPAKVSFRAGAYRTAVRVLDDSAQLRRTLDSDGRPIAAPLRGVLLTDYLARMLGAVPGDGIVIDPLDARTPPVVLQLAGTTHEPFGAQAYVSADTFDAVFDRPLQDSGWLLAVDRLRQRAVLQALDRRPVVAGIDQRGLAIRNFREGMANTILTFTLIATGFGIVIALGVVYSAARVSLSEQSRDLASLRILGFTRGEVSYLLIGELVLLALAAVPLGFAVGHGLAALLIAGFDSDLFRIPHYISLRTHALAGAISLACALVCGYGLRRRLDRLDLVAVLKARE
jgi:putative ABC transport system permease protein